MKNLNVIIDGLDLKGLQNWVPTVNAHLVPVYKPEFFIKMGFPETLVRPYIEKFVPIRAKDGTDVQPVEGVSGGLFLHAIAKLIGADTSEGDRKLSLSNSIEEWRKACIKRIDEILRDDGALRNKR